MEQETAAATAEAAAAVAAEAVKAKADAKARADALAAVDAERESLLGETHAARQGVVSSKRRLLALENDAVAAVAAAAASDNEATAVEGQLEELRRRKRVAEEGEAAAEAERLKLESRGASMFERARRLQWRFWRSVPPKRRPLQTLRRSALRLARARRLERGHGRGTRSEPQLVVGGGSD